jgi:hypothetical protein
LTWKNYYSRPIRGLRAIASHSNSSASIQTRYSGSIQNEGQIYHEDKETILPCGYSVAESWAALRKSWLGFKIANANADTERMAEYASYIRKVQLEMGLSVTNFDPWILEDQQLESDDEANYEYAANQEESILEEKLEVAYDEIMYEAGRELKRTSCDAPRNHLFDGSSEFEGSGTVAERDSSGERPVMDKEGKEGGNLECKTDPRWEERIRKSCVYRPNRKGQQWEERIRKSCVYRPKNMETEDEQEEGLQSGTGDTDYSNLDSGEVNNDNESENGYTSESYFTEEDNLEEDKKSNRKSCKYVRK